MKKLIYLIVIVSFIDMFSQLPIMSPFAQSLGATPALIGLIIGMYSFSNMIGNMLSGYFIDKIGPKTVLVMGLSITGIIVSFYVFVSTPGQLLFVRFFHGLSAGLLVPAAFTLLSFISKSDQQGKSMALSGAAVGISAILGPAFGGIVANSFGINFVFIPISITMILMAVLVSVYLIRTTIFDTGDESLHLAEAIKLIKTPVLFVGYVGAFSLMFAQGVLAYMLPLKVEDLGYGSHFSGLLLSTFGIVAILIFILPTNKMFDRYSHTKMLVAGLIIIALSLTGLSFTSKLELLFLVMTCYGIGFAILFPSLTTLMVKNSSKAARGKVFGLFYAFFSLGVVAGSSITGLLSVDYNEGFVIGGAALIINTLFISYLIRKHTFTKS